jgi:hypothetical protein
VIRFTWQKLPTIKREHVLCPTKKCTTECCSSVAYSSSSFPLDYWDQPLKMRTHVCYLDCHEAVLCCYLVISIENLLCPLQLFYFHFWPVYWLSLISEWSNWGEHKWKHALGRWKMHTISLIIWGEETTQGISAQMAGKLSRVPTACLLFHPEDGSITFLWKLKSLSHYTVSLLIEFLVVPPSPLIDLYIYHPTIQRYAV